MTNEKEASGRHTHLIHGSFAVAESECPVKKEKCLTAKIMAFNIQDKHAYVYANRVMHSAADLRMVNKRQSLHSANK